MADKVNIKNLNEAEAVKVGDYLIIETSDGTKILDFKNFSIDTSNTTFAGTLSTQTADISSNYSLIQQISGSVDANKTLVSEVSGLTGLNWRDGYSALITYKKQDAVEYEESSFVSKVDSNTGNTPVDGYGTLNSNWNYLAKKGSITLPLSSPSAILSYDGSNLIEVKPSSDSEIGYVLTSKGVSNTPVWSSNTDGRGGQKCERLIHGDIGSKWHRAQASAPLLMTDGKLLTHGDSLATIGGAAANAHGPAEADGISWQANPALFDSKTWTMSSDKIKNVSYAGDSLFVVSSAGDVYFAGHNSDGEGGQGDTTARYILTRIDYFYNNNIKIDRVWINDSQDASYLTQTSVFLTTGGDVYTCGKNDVGQLGIGNTTDSTTPVQAHNIGNPSPQGDYRPVTDIWHGGMYSSTYAKISGGDNNAQNETVYAWGRNDSGRLGDGTTSNKTVPTLIPGLSGVIKMQVPCEGLYYDNQGTTAGLTSHALYKNGKIASAGTNTNSHAIFGDGTTAAATRTYWCNVSGVSAFTDFSHNGSSRAAIVGIDGDTGEVWAWGQNEDYQIDGGRAGYGASTTVNTADTEVPTPLKLSNITGLLSGCHGSNNNWDIRGKISEAWYASATTHLSEGPRAHMGLRDTSGEFWGIGMMNTATVADGGNYSLAFPALNLGAINTTAGAAKWTLPCDPAEIAEWTWWNAADYNSTDQDAISYFLRTNTGRVFVYGARYGAMSLVGNNALEAGYSAFWGEVRF